MNMLRLFMKYIHSIPLTIAGYAVALLQQLIYDIV